MSRTARNLVVYAPDGTEVTFTTSGTYDTAGIVRKPGGPWALAARGWSWASVERRTRARCAALSAVEMHVGDSLEKTAPLIREYFGTHDVRVADIFIPAAGWETGLRLRAGRSVLRQLALDGVTAIAVRGPRPGGGGLLVVADFQMDEIARSAKFRLSDNASASA